MTDVYSTFQEPSDRVVLRTEDVYQTEMEDGVVGYSDTLLAVVANFRNSGAPEGFNAQSMAGKSKRGEIACRLFASINPTTEVIEQVGFKARGCLAMTAAASMVCTMITGKTIEEALTLTTNDLYRALDGVPSGKVSSLDFAIEAVRGLVGDYLVNKGVSLETLDQRVPCDEYSLSCLVSEHCSFRTTRIQMRMSEKAIKDEAGELPPLAEQDEAERKALAAVFDNVREQTRRRKLSSSRQWVERGLVPSHMDAEQFATYVLTYLDDWNRDNGVAGETVLVESPYSEQEIEGNDNLAAHVRSAYSSSPGRCVGVPMLFSSGQGASQSKPVATVDSEMKSDVPNDDLADDKGFVNTGANSVVGGDPAVQDEHMAGDETNSGGDDDGNADFPFPDLRIPTGKKLVKLEGEYVLVDDETVDESQKSEHDLSGSGDDLTDVDPIGIKALRGKGVVYLYDGRMMTDAYARWIFLAEENDPLVTFATMVREESRLYPRPMPPSTLENEPFAMDAETIELLYNQAKESEAYGDIARIVTSNGRSFYYSSTYLSEARAQAMAEWAAVGRLMNP